MDPDRLSIPSLLNGPLQSARSSAPDRDATASFASFYAEALQSAEETISELGSLDSDGADAAGDASGPDDMLGLLELRAACLSGASADAAQESFAGELSGTENNEWLGIESALGRLANSLSPGLRPATGGGIPGIGAATDQADGACAPAAMGRAIDWLDSHAQLHSTHRCAASVREAMEAAGIPTADRPASGDAGDYGPFLRRHGAQVVAPDNYQPRAGDIAVFDKSVDHPNGHVQVFDGQHWVSDFLQHTFSPYRDQQSTPSVTVYRMS